MKILIVCVKGVGGIQRGCRCGVGGGSEEVRGDQDAWQEENHAWLILFFSKMIWVRNSQNSAGH